MLQVLSGWDPADPGSAAVSVPDFSARLDQGVRGLRIGLIRHFYEEDDWADETVRAAMGAAVATFVELGATVDEV